MKSKVKNLHLQKLSNKQMEVIVGGCCGLQQLGFALAMSATGFSGFIWAANYVAGGC
jgi:hypothetical protein